MLLNYWLMSKDERRQECASAGNRTRVTSMATMYSTTRPLMLVLVRIARFRLATASETGCRTTRHADSKSMIKHSAPVAILSGASRFFGAFTRSTRFRILVYDFFFVVVSRREVVPSRPAAN